MPTCQDLKTAYEQLQEQARQFQQLYPEDSLTKENLTQARILKYQLTDALKNLEGQVLGERLHLPEQYESQKNILTQTGVLETLSDGQEGIVGIDGKEYPFPTYEEIQQHFLEREDILTNKMEQGFTKLLVTPFGMSLDSLLEKYKQTILTHHQAGKLLATKKDPSDPDEKLRLDTSNPMYVWEKYQNADKDGSLVYYPKSFDETNHQGKTKQEIINQKGSYNILLIEDLPNIPREGKGTTKANRKQLESGKSPTDYLNAIQDNATSPYNNEQGLTPEDHIIYAITHLEETNQVIDDFQGNGSLNYNLGAFFPKEGASGVVPYACWYRDGRQAFVGRFPPVDRDGAYGARAAVGVNA